LKLDEEMSTRGYYARFSMDSRHSIIIWHD